jgi:hypothetical protein
MCEGTIYVYVFSILALDSEAGVLSGLQYLTLRERRGTCVGPVIEC